MNKARDVECVVKAKLIEDHADQIGDGIEVLGVFKMEVDKRLLRYGYVA